MRRLVEGHTGVRLTRAVLVGILVGFHGGRWLAA
jgi:hypothetical protein